jgi:hypothetical protein
VRARSVGPRSRPGRRRGHARVGRGAAVALCLCALAVGLGTGRLLLPDRTTGGSPPAARGAATPTRGTGVPRPTYPRTPPTEEDLVGVAAFGRAGLSVRQYPENGNTAPDLAVSSCTSERTVGARTMGDITGHDPQVFGTWEEPSTTETANEYVAMAPSPRAAEVAAGRLLAAHTTCQQQPVGHWVYGRAHRRQVAEGVWAAWLGLHPGSQNRTGQAPAGADPCGGVAVLRNGRRFAVLEVFMCTDAGQLGTLALAAATRLG